MNRSRLFLTAVTLLTFGAVSQGALSPVGTWHGKMQATFTAPPPNPSANGQAPVDTSVMKKKIEDDLKKVKITVTVKKGGVYVATSTQADGRTLKTTGQWTLKGHTFTMKPNPVKEESGSVTHPNPRVGTIAANGKRMVVPIPAGLASMGIHGQIVFTKG